VKQINKLHTWKGGEKNCRCYYCVSVSVRPSAILQPPKETKLKSTTRWKSTTKTWKQVNIAPTPSGVERLVSKRMGGRDEQVYRVLFHEKNRNLKKEEKDEQKAGRTAVVCLHT